MTLKFPKIWSKKNNKLPLDLTPLIGYTTLMNKTTHILDAGPHNDLPSNPIELASALTGKTLVYNAIKSTVRSDNTRVFKVQKVDDVYTSNSTGEKCVTVWANDIDRDGELVPRTLHVHGIKSIS
tara:strand:- start:390 stop:764 length:375 start_codon:yes stop_codon:yes gene_type:complete